MEYFNKEIFNLKNILLLLLLLLLLFLLGKVPLFQS